MTYLEHLDDIFRFGKFRGCTLGEVLTFSPSYISWVVKNVSGRVCKITDTAIEEAKIIFPNLCISKDFEKHRRRQLQYECLDDGIDDDYYEDSYCIENEEPTYEKYAGSYAQDEMGYSDDDIDTIFDGDPSAYWNID